MGSLQISSCIFLNYSRETVAHPVPHLLPDKVIPDWMGVKDSVAILDCLESMDYVARMDSLEQLDYVENLDHLDCLEPGGSLDSLEVPGLLDLKD